jgi:hypothetical protein
MKLPSVNKLSVLLAGTVLLCHGIFGALHLVCDSLACAGAAEHAAEHEPTAGTTGDSHEHPASHGASADYFAVIAGLLGLLLSLLPEGLSSRVRIGTRWSTSLRRASVVFRPAQAPTSPVLQVCSGSESLFAPVRQEQGS